VEIHGLMAQSQAKVYRNHDPRDWELRREMQESEAREMAKIKARAEAEKK